jgi:hypothetical protein
MNINPAQHAVAQAPVYAASGPGANPLAVADAVDLTLDLTRSSRNLIGAILGLDREELQDFLTITSNLIHAGVVGRETVEVDGRPRETHTDARMADPSLRGAPPYRRNRLDLRA